MQTTSDTALNGDNGLCAHTKVLPADAYHDAGRYELELQRIWYRNWVYAARSSEVAELRSFRTVELGNQTLLLVRDDAGVLRGYHNTCRHRGAALCRERAGVLRSDALICPYHSWSYSLQGDLLRTSSKRHGAGFDAAALSLYKISVHEWNGFIFIALNDSPPSFDRGFDVPVDRLDGWPLSQLRVGHVLVKTIQCNWKIFWENYNECLHCPAVHLQLSQLVPLYGRGFLEERDDPSWTDHAADAHPRYKGGLRSGAHTWSLNGQLSGVPFASLSAEDRTMGAVYMTGYPSMFIVGHPDYVRVVRLLPRGPERTELRVEYLFSQENLASPKFDMRNVVEFTNRVMTEDAEICELNQRGLRALPHVGGVVMPEEYGIAQFHEWVAAQLSRP